MVNDQSFFFSDVPSILGLSYPGMCWHIGVLIDDPGSSDLMSTSRSEQGLQGPLSSHDILLHSFQFISIQSNITLEQTKIEAENQWFPVRKMISKSRVFHIYMFVYKRAIQIYHPPKKVLALSSYIPSLHLGVLENGVYLAQWQV